MSATLLTSIVFLAGGALQFVAIKRTDSAIPACIARMPIKPYWPLEPFLYPRRYALWTWLRFYAALGATMGALMAVMEYTELLGFAAQPSRLNFIAWMPATIFCVGNMLTLGWQKRWAMREWRRQNDGRHTKSIGKAD